MEYNQCYNMNKSYSIILNKNSKFQKTTYDIILFFFLVLKSEHNKYKLTCICGKTSFRKKVIETGTVIISGGG